MKLLRKTALFLALALLVSSMMFSCKDKDDEIDRDGWWLSDAGGRPSTPDDLPDDIDFEGFEFLVLYRNGLISETEGSFETEANPVDQTVYERNLKIQSRLNAKITWIPTDAGSLADTTNQISTVLNTQEEYHFFITTNNSIVINGNNSRLVDLSFADYINLNQPWWWKDVIEELAFDGTTFNFLVGDMNITNINKMSAFYFNCDLIQERLTMQPKDFYNMVDENRWTIEILEQLSKKCYRDLNGNQLADADDSYGFACVGGETLDQFVFSTRILDQLYERSSDGRSITLNFKGNNDLVTVTEMITNLIHNNEGVYNWTSAPTGTYDSTLIQQFSEGKYVFLPQRLTAATTDFMREMESDYGIIPYPTIDEGDEYVSFIQQSSTSVCVPVVAERVLDKVGMCIEALCAEAYRYTTEAFYNVALKNKYARDDDASRMIDLIYETASKSFLCEYNYKAASICSIFSSCISNQTSVATQIASKADAAQNQINQYISETFRSMS